MAKPNKQIKVVGNTLVLPPEVQTKVVNYMSDCRSRFDFGTRRHSYARIDKAIQLESDARRNLKGQREQRLDYYDDIEVSLVTQAVDTVKGFLVDLFLSRHNILEAVPSASEDISLAQQVDAINERDSKDYAWARNFTIAFGDLAKYNKCALEVDWDTELVQSLQTANSGPRSRKEVVEVPRSGNRIRRLDLYNQYHDEKVEVSEVHRYGEFTGYDEMISMVELVRRIRNLKAQGKAVMNHYTCFSAPAALHSEDYFRPCIVPEAPQSESTGGSWGGDWTAYFSSDSKLFKDSTGVVKPTNEYLWTCLYARIIPSMFGITNVPNPDNVHIYRMYKVGSTLICMERMNNVHNYFNIVTAQVKEEGIGEQVKSDAALVIPLQNLATKLYDARMTALAKHVGNKFAYVDGTVDPASLSHPSKPIIVKPNMLIKDPLQAIKQLPFEDRIGPNFHQEINNIRMQAQEITRLNRAQMGQFQKGNKTASEFNEIMNNADSELRTFGLMFENVVMEPLKTIIKANIAQFQEPEEITTMMGDKVEVNPLLLSTKTINFKLADGLTRKEAISNVDALNVAYQNLLNNPALAAQFDMAAMYVYMVEVMGAKISQFRLPPAQQAGAPAQQTPQPGQVPAQNPVR
jgi:hypothetical protein